jgi:hypothetical protein
MGILLPVLLIILALAAIACVCSAFTDGGNDP